MTGSTACAVAEERRRIARELHNVVGHNVSLLMIAAQALGTGAGGEARRLGDSIATLGREARDELATTLKLLRPDARTADSPRRPSLPELPRLVDPARRAGVGAELRIEGARRPVPDAVHLSGYRTVQEGLTNVIRHADARRATVSLRYGADAIGPRSSTTAPARSPTPPTPGHGLLGMRERAASFGGTLTCGRRACGGFRVAAVLPAV